MSWWIYMPLHSIKHLKSVHSNKKQVILINKHHQNLCICKNTIIYSYTYTLCICKHSVIHVKTFNKWTVTFIKNGVLSIVMITMCWRGVCAHVYGAFVHWHWTFSSTVPHVILGTGSLTKPGDHWFN